MTKTEEKWRRKNEKYKIEYPVNHNRKYWFRGRKKFKSISLRPRATGVCENWVKPKHERIDWIDGI